jgi:hypothetical protein
LFPEARIWGWQQIETLPDGIERLTDQRYVMIQRVSSPDTARSTWELNAANEQSVERERRITSELKATVPWPPPR